MQNIMDMKNKSNPPNEDLQHIPQFLPDRQGYKMALDVICNIICILLVHFSRHFNRISDGQHIIARGCTADCCFELHSGTKQIVGDRKARKRKIMPIKEIRINLKKKKKNLLLLDQGMKKRD